MMRNLSNQRFCTLKYRFILGISFAYALGCYGSTNRDGSGETHFLRGCAECDKCASGLECICGVCTVRCEDNDICKAQNRFASCMPSDCSEERICDVECVENEDCSDLGSKYSCQKGRCRVATAASKETKTDDSETSDSGTGDAGTGKSDTNDGGISHNDGNDSGSSSLPCLGTDRADEITTFTMSHSGGMPILCSDGFTTFDGYETYEVDFIETVIAYNISISCEPLKTGKAAMTDEQISRVRSDLVALEPQFSDGCWVDYGEGTLSIPGCSDYKNEASDSVCYDSTVPVLPYSGFSALQRTLREISLASYAVTGDISCPQGCTVITASPVTDCVEQAEDFPKEEWNVACECSGDDPSDLIPQCRLRLSDNSAWFFAASVLANPDAWGECSEEQIKASSISCDFKQCRIPPPTTCDSESWCTDADCGGLQFDEQGCSRRSCDSDSDCEDDARCVAIDCRDLLECNALSADRCECLIAPDLCVHGSFCNPGPREEWELIEVFQSILVSGGDTVESRWSVTPDGQVEFDKEGTTGTATLSAADLSTLEELLDEDQLRVALRDGIECSSIPLDGAGYRILLVSDGQTFERVVSDCVVGPEGNIFQRLIGLLTAYPKGEWDRLQISIQYVVPCPPDELCGEIWTITPNGELQINESGVIRTASLNQQDLAQLEQLIPELRVALRDGIACDTQLDGASHSVLLEIDGQTFERDVTDCILEPEENVIQRLYDLVTTY